MILRQVIGDVQLSGEVWIIVNPDTVTVLGSLFYCAVDRLHVFELADSIKIEFRRFSHERYLGGISILALKRRGLDTPSFRHSAFRAYCRIAVQDDFTWIPAARKVTVAPSAATKICCPEAVIEAWFGGFP